MSYQQFFKKASEASSGGRKEIKRTETRRSDADRRGPRPRANPATSPNNVKFNVKRETAAQEEKRLRASVRFTSRQKAPFPWKAFVGLAVSIGAVTTYLVAPESIEKFAGHFEISAMGAASAADKANEKAAEKSKSASTGKEKAAGAAEAGNPDHGPEAKATAPEDLSHFEKLKQRKEELDLREKELSELEEELQKQKVELDKRITQLEDMRNQIAKTLKDRVEVDQEKVAKLVDLYSNMKPKQAADVIGSINEDLAVEVLAKMKKKNAAEVMNLLSPEKARTLSEKYTGYRRNMTDPKG